MSLPPSIYNEMLELLDAVCRGQASDEQLVRIEQIAVSNREAMELYIDYLDNDALLHWWSQERGSQDAVAGAGELPTKADRERPHSDPIALPTFDDAHSDSQLDGRSPILGFLGNWSSWGTNYTPTFWALVVMVAGVVVTAGSLAVLLVFGINIHIIRKSAEVAQATIANPPSSPTSTAQAARSADSAVVATVTAVVDCRWTAGCPVVQPRDCVAVGRKFDLEAGVVAITYDTGARVILHGPVSYKIATNNSGYLAYGGLTGIVEKIGAGKAASDERDLFGCQPPAPDPPQFTVHTPEADVTDLGTEFGVRVGKPGRMESHVFRGKIKVGVSAATEPAATPSREIIVNVDESIRVDKQADGIPVVMLRGGAVPLPDFLHETEIVAHNDAAEETSPEFERWRASSAALRQRPDLVAYYDFQPDQGRPMSLPNRAATGQPLHGELDGELVGGAEWVDGRFPGKKAIKFASPGSGVRIDLPTKLSHITLVTSVQVDRLGPLNSLVHSDGWNQPGQFAWQINHSGVLSVGIHSDIFDVKHRVREQDMAWPKTSVARDLLSHWCQLAVVYDGAAGRARFYLNGRQTGDLPIAAHRAIVLGPALIGTRLADAKDANPGDRTLCGRMDELMFFNAALSAEEIAHLAPPHD